MTPRFSLVFLVVLFLAFSCLPEAGAQEESVQGSNAAAYASYLQAILDRSSGNLDRARSLLEQALRSKPGSSGILMALIDVSIRLKDLDNARSWAEKALAEEPGNQKARIALARIMAAQGQFPRAMELIDEVLAVDQTNQEALFWAGTMAAQAGDHDRAVSYLERAVAAGGGGQFMPYYYLGIVYREKKDYEKATMNLEKAVEINPGFDAAWNDLARAYLLKGDTQKAVEIFRTFVEDEPGNIEARMRLFQILMEAGEVEKAREELVNLREMGIGNLDIDLQIASLTIRLGMHDEAIRFLDELERKQPDDRILLFKAQALEEKDDPEGAILVLGLIRDKRLLGEATARKVSLLAGTGRISEAIRILDEIVRNEPPNIQWYLLLADLYEKDHLPDDAVRTLREALRLHPEDTKILFAMVMTLDKNGEKDEAMTLAERILAIDGNHAGALNYIGYTYAEQGVRLDEAEAMITKALAARPDDGYVTDSLGWVYFRKGDYEKAIRYLEQAQRAVEDDPVIAEHLGDAYAAAGRHKNAIEAFEKALRILGDSLKDRLRLKRKIREVERKIGRNR